MTQQLTSSMHASAPPRELWLLNFYRNSELHGALLMGRLARSVAKTELLVHFTEHCATEAHHAAILTEAIAELGGEVDPRVQTVQERYSAKGGVPTALVDLLVLSEILEHRVLDTYRAHVARQDIHPVVRRALETILREMEEEHGDAHAGWIDQELKTHPHDVVEAAEEKWKQVDKEAVGDLRKLIDSKFVP
jgi:bacterioferritin (cytochrome b1)